jgi:hypothetical protein
MVYVSIELWGVVISSHEFLILYTLCFYSCIWESKMKQGDRLCSLMVNVPGYRSRGPEFDSGRYQIF